MTTEATDAAPEFTAEAEREEVRRARHLLSEAERLRESGDEVNALLQYRRAAEESARVFAPATEAAALLGAAEMQRFTGEPAAAIATLNDAIARAVEAGEPLVEARAWFVLATTAFDEGRSKDGHDALLEAMTLYREGTGREAQEGLALATRTYGEHLAVLGSASDARDALRLARAMYDALGDPSAVAGIDADLAKVAEFAR